PEDELDDLAGITFQDMQIKENPKFYRWVNSNNRSLPSERT
ncbi:hypothetical protein LCGC14_1982200, partial [marine sediment metagenome]